MAESPSGCMHPFRPQIDAIKCATQPPPLRCRPRPAEGPPPPPPLKAPPGAPQLPRLRSPKVEIYNAIRACVVWNWENVYTAEKFPNGITLTHFCSGYVQGPAVTNWGSRRANTAQSFLTIVV